MLKWTCNGDQQRPRLRDPCGRAGMRRHARRMYWRSSAACLFAAAAIVCTPVTHASDRETETCDGEATAFWFWSTAAAFTPYTSVSRMTGGEQIAYTAGDGVELSGIRLNADGPAPAKGYLLILQGNGFPAGSLIQEFEPIRELGIDVYAYDYRGYKRSGGKRRMSAIAQDYGEIISSLNQKYPRRFVYATSFGGSVASVAIQDFSVLDLLVFDGVFSRPSTLFQCRVNYDPVDHLPKDCRNLVAQRGVRDPNANYARAHELLDAVEHCGGLAKVVEWGHPFMTDSKDEIASRVAEIRSMLEKYVDK